MNDATIKSTVGIQMSPEGMAGAAKQFDSVLQKTIANLNKAASTAERAVNSSAKAGQAATQQMNGQLKALAITLGQIKTLQSSLTSIGAKGTINSAGLLGDFGATGNIGRQARAITDYRNSLKGASSAMTTLRDRVRQFDQQAGNLAKRGQTLSQSQIFKAEKINETAQAYSRVSNQIGSLRGRVALLGTDGQKAFKPMLDQLTQLEKANAKAFSNRRRSNYQPEISATQKLVRNVNERLVAREKLEKASRLNIESLRQEGLQITRNTALEREAALAKSVRAANSRFNNLQLIGGTIRQRDTDQVSRFARATALAASNQNQLTAALNRPNTSARRIQALINRHKQLQREIGESLSAQNRMDAPRSKGGFFAGLNQGKKNAFAGDEGGGAFGAGALVGRVGAYALAAGAVYGFISAVQQGIGFTIQFEDALAQLQAVSGSTTLEMERLSNTIFKVSKNSANSVMELTKSATIIAQAGFAGSEIGGLLENVVNLAGASGSSTDEAVDILTSTLGAFQLQASEATRVTDGLVAALNDSKLSVNQVQLGLQYVGATARLNNITFNELVATLGAMADAGIRSGSTMSTGLRQMLVDFIDPSKKLIAQLEKVGLTTADIDVKTLGLTEVLGRLRDSGFQGYGALETRAAAAYAVLSANIPNIQKLELATLRQGAAAEAQAARMSSLSAQWQSFINRLSQAGSEIYDNLSPILEGLMVVLGGLTLVVIDLVEGISKFIGGLVGLPSVLIDLSVATADSSFTLSELRENMEQAGFSAEEIDSSLQGLAATHEDLQTSMNDAKAEMSSLELQKQSLGTEIGKLISRQESLDDSQASVALQTEILASRFPGLRDEFKKTQGGIAGLITSMQALDRQTAATLAGTARRLLVMQKMLKSNADSTLRGLGTQTSIESISVDILPESLHSSSKPVFDFRRALQGKDYTTAEKLLNGKGGDLIMRNMPETVAAFTQARADQASASNNITNYENQLQGFEFAAGETGSTLNREVQAAVANAERAASQGSAKGQSPAQITSTLKGLTNRIDSLTEENAGKDGVLAFLGSARASAQAAIYGLAPEEKDSAAKKTGRGGKRAKGTRSAERLQRQQDRDFQRNEALIQREELEYRKEFYDNQLRMLENAPTLEDIPDLMDEVDNGLTEYLNAESEAALTAILKNMPSQAELDKMSKQQRDAFLGQKNRLLATAARKAEQLRQENVDKITGVLSEVISKFVETSTKAIERQFQEATRFAQRNVDKAQAEVEGLQRPSLNSNVPDYFVTVKQRELEIAQERKLRADIPAKDTEIRGRQEISNRAQDEIRALASELINLGKVKEEADVYGNNTIVVTGNVDDPDLKRFQDLVQSMREYDEETQDMIDANQDLKASFEILNEVPTTLSEGMKTAFEAVKIEMNSSGDFMQDMIKGLDEPLRTARDSFATFFNEVLTGSTSVGQAIRNMIGSILDSIVNMISQALANQAFLALGKLVGLDTGAQEGAGQEEVVAQGATVVAQGAVAVAQGGAVVAEGGAAIATASGTVVSGAASVASTAATTITSLAEVLVSIGEAMTKVVEAAAQVAASSAGAGGEGGEGGGLIGGLVNLATGSWRGGMVTGRGKYRGGEIMEGLKTRDSVLTPTAKGEFIVREAAVSSIGTDMLNSMNAQGAAALKGVGAPSISVQSAPVETNLYVVAPNNKPTLGPNDVIAIITDDVLKGGQTKKLIKKVSNG